MSSIRDCREGHSVAVSFSVLCWGLASGQRAQTYKRRITEMLCEQRGRHVIHYSSAIRVWRTLEIKKKVIDSFVLKSDAIATSFLILIRLDRSHRNIPTSHHLQTSNRHPHAHSEQNKMYSAILL